MAIFNKKGKRPRRVVEKDKINDTDTQRLSSDKKNKKKSSNSYGVYYSFLTIILLLCLIQITISAILNVSKFVSYKAKIIQITKTLNAAKALNAQLKDNINNFSNVAGLEAIARNNLKMSSEDEVLVIINTSKEEEKEEKQKKIGFIKYD